MNIKKLINKNKDIIPYLFFGVCTTVVNVIVYWICAHFINMSTLLSTVIAWGLAVLFAYITNKKWVFHSKVVTRIENIKEILSFFICRLTTGIIDWMCMIVFVGFLEFNDVIIKILANILVIILNYMASKLIIFKKRKIYKKFRSGWRKNVFL